MVLGCKTPTTNQSQLLFFPSLCLPEQQLNDDHVIIYFNLLDGNHTRHTVSVYSQVPFTSESTNRREDILYALDAMDEEYVGGKTNTAKVGQSE